jgi:hypothetical protein
VLPTAIVIGVLWEVAKYLYVLVLPRWTSRLSMDPFYVSVGLMIWAFLSGLLLLAGAHFSATRYALSVARQEERRLAAGKEAGMGPTKRLSPNPERQAATAVVEAKASDGRGRRGLLARAVVWAAVAAAPGARFPATLLGWMQVLVGWR